MIVCKLCLVEKEEENFNASARKSNGKNSYCKLCQSKKNKAWMQENVIHRSNYEKGYKGARQDHVRETKQKWDAENKEHRSVYRQARKPQYAAHAMKRYVTIKLSQPFWLSESQLKEIEMFYWLAADLKTTCGETYHVDHIVPLQGKNVCGLHVPWNLQILPADVNIRKSNKHEE